MFVRKSGVFLDLPPHPPLCADVMYGSSPIVYALNLHRRRIDAYAGNKLSARPRPPSPPLFQRTFLPGAQFLMHVATSFGKENPGLSPKRINNKAFTEVTGWAMMHLLILLDDGRCWLRQYTQPLQHFTSHLGMPSQTRISIMGPLIFPGPLSTPTTLGVLQSISACSV